MFSLFFLITFSNDIMSQDTGYDRLSWGISYSGNNLWNPGVKGAVYLVLKERSQSTNSSLQPGRLLLSNYFGFYHDPGSHSALYYTYGAEYKFPSEGNQLRSVYIHPAGIYRSFLPETYEVNATGTIERVSLPGRFYYSPAAGFRFGRTFTDKRIRGWQAGVTIVLLIPYNTYVMPLINIEAGILLPWKGWK